MKRIAILPNQGTALVSTDVHGCLDDFDRMQERFEAADDATHWVILGDIVHGPDDRARARNPSMYDYPDDSGEIARRIRVLQERYPGRVHFVIGNHDWAHVGGPPTRKFHDDEAAFLESNLEEQEIRDLRELIRSALLCVMAPCGAFMSHGSPAALPDSLEELDAIDIGGELDQRQAALIKEFTNWYGQREAVSRSFLDYMSRLSELDLTFVVHGHDRDELGFFAHENTQICPVIFGAPKENKRYLRLDLSTRYNSVADLHDGSEILKLWSDD